MIWNVSILFGEDWKCSLAVCLPALRKRISISDYFCAQYPSSMSCKQWTLLVHTLRFCRPVMRHALQISNSEQLWKHGKAHYSQAVAVHQSGKIHYRGAVQILHFKKWKVLQLSNVTAWPEENYLEQGTRHLHSCSSLQKGGSTTAWTLFVDILFCFLAVIDCNLNGCLHTLDVLQPHINHVAFTLGAFIKPSLSKKLGNMTNTIYFSDKQCSLENKKTVLCY